MLSRMFGTAGDGLHDSLTDFSRGSARSGAAGLASDRQERRSHARGGGATPPPRRDVKGWSHALLRSCVCIPFDR